MLEVVTVSANTIPCTMWTTDELVRACCGGLEDDYDLGPAIQFASEILFRLSGRQFPGVCTQTVWPCQATGCGGGEDPAWGALAASDWHFGYQGGYGSGTGVGYGYAAGYPSVPYPTGNGGWDNCWDCGGGISSGVCGGGCRLPWLTVPGPIMSIQEIVVHGEVLPPSSYVIEGGRRIGRLDGHNWPCSNNLRDLRLLSDSAFMVVVSGTSGSWDLTVTVDGVDTVFTVGAGDDAATLQAALVAFYGPLSAVVTGGPADDLGSAPFGIFFTTTVVGPTVAISADASGLFIGVDPGSVATSLVNAGSEPGPDAWYVTYSYGKAVPPGGVFAASKFACQIALSNCGSEDCVLPQRLKEITREGVSMAFADPLDFIDKGEVGIYEVDLWLHSVNPKKLQRRASIYRADAQQAPKRFS